MANQKSYIITVDGNPQYCGVGAGGAQFAHGQATITDDRMASWFQEHEGYTVKEITTADDGASGGSATAAKSGMSKRGNSPASN